MQLLDGKKTAEDIKSEIAAEVQKIKDNGGKVPHLAAVIVENPGPTHGSGSATPGQRHRCSVHGVHPVIPGSAGAAPGRRAT